MVKRWTSKQQVVSSILTMSKFLLLFFPFSNIAWSFMKFILKVLMLLLLRLGCQATWKKINVCKVASSLCDVFVAYLVRALDQLSGDSRFETHRGKLFQNFFFFSYNNNSNYNSNNSKNFNVWFLVIIYLPLKVILRDNHSISNNSNSNSNITNTNMSVKKWK